MICIAEVKIGIVEWEVPLWAESAANGFKNCRLRGVAFSDQAKNLLIRKFPFQMLDASEIEDIYFSYFHGSSPYAKNIVLRPQANPG